MTEIKREDLVASVGFDPLKNRQRREDYANGVRAALAEAYRWVRQATGSDDEAGEMVVECLKVIDEPKVTPDSVFNEASK